MKWITRDRPKTDRIACPWLIRRFIDPDAEIVYAPADQVLVVAERDGGHSFDAPEPPTPTAATPAASKPSSANTSSTPTRRWSGWRGSCTPPTSKGPHTDALGAGLLAIGIGGLDVETDDHGLLDRASFVYDALYAWCQRDVRTAGGG